MHELCQCDVRALPKPRQQRLLRIPDRHYVPRRICGMPCNDTLTDTLTDTLADTLTDTLADTLTDTLTDTCADSLCRS